MKAITAAGAAIERELLSGTDYSMSQDSDEALARVALLAAAPMLTEAITTALLNVSVAGWGRGGRGDARIVIPISQIAPTVKHVIEEAANGH